MGKDKLCAGGRTGAGFRFGTMRRIMPNNKKIKTTSKQDRFLVELQKGKSGKDAAIAAGYSAKSAINLASVLKRKPHIADKIDRAKKKVEDKMEMTKEKALNRFVELSLNAEKHEQFGPSVKSHEIFCNAMGYLNQDANKEQNNYAITITTPKEESNP